MSYSKRVRWINCTPFFLQIPTAYVCQKLWKPVDIVSKLRAKTKCAQHNVEVSLSSALLSLITELFIGFSCSAVFFSALLFIIFTNARKVMFLPLSVCVSARLLKKVMNALWFLWQAWRGLRNNRIDFGGYPHHDPNLVFRKKRFYYIRRRLASGEGIVKLGVCVSFRRAATARASHYLDGNALYPVLSSLLLLIPIDSQE